MPSSLREYLDFVTETAFLAGRLTLGFFQTDLRPDYKSDNSPVTLADRQAEQLVRARIEKYFPTHAIVGEEFGAKESERVTHRWFIDPIDGTKAFTRGVPLYAVLIGLEINGKIEVGAAYAPALNEMVVAASGEGCWWNGRRAHVSQVAELKSAYLLHADVGNFDQHNRAREFDRLCAATYARAGGGDAYGYMLVATGRAEVMLDPIMSVWDNGPFPVILREAGGYFGNWQGEETIYGNEAVATTQVLLPEVLKVIHGQATNN